MQNLKRLVLASVCVLFTIVLYNSQTFVSQAQESTLPGYHVYTNTGTEAIDTWYGIARGTYLESGTSGLVSAGKGKVNVSGTTNAHSVCDEVKVAVYLDESVNGDTGFGTIGSYYYSEKNTTSCHGSKANISVTSGWWYSVRGVHTVIEGSTIESTSTQTKAMQAP